MSNHAAIFRKVLETDPQWLNQIRRGVEKESLESVKIKRSWRKHRIPQAGFCAHSPFNHY